MERRRIIGLKLFLKFCKKKSRERFGISRSQEKKTFIGCARGLLDEREREKLLSTWSSLLGHTREERALRAGPTGIWVFSFSGPSRRVCVVYVVYLYFQLIPEFTARYKFKKKERSWLLRPVKNISNIFLFSSCHPPEDWKWTLVNNGLLVTVRLSVCLSGYSFLSLFCLQAKGVQKWIPSYFSYLSTMRKKGNGKDRPPASLQATFKSSYTYYLTQSVESSGPKFV